MIENIDISITRDGIDHVYNLSANPGHTITNYDINNVVSWLESFGIGYQDNPTDPDEPIVPDDDTTNVNLFDTTDQINVGSENPATEIVDMEETQSIATVGKRNNRRW